MIKKDYINILLSEHLEGTGMFIVDINITKDNRIHVFIDADNGLTIDDCVNVHRYVESKLDREKEDFELKVSSSGVDNGLKVARQYVKNIGRLVEIVTNEETRLEGELISADDEEIEVKIQASGKKKKPGTEVGEVRRILLSEIKETKVKVTFKKKQTT
jgi:ribosome maturation factor RimP